MLAIDVYIDSIRLPGVVSAYSRAMNADTEVAALVMNPGVMVCPRVAKLRARTRFLEELGHRGFFAP